ncbi:hypothetical protein [Clostridium sp.]|uniref:hypothetical protein n=1 Tax=Clostridium sp. TaxID=1506 RepID=UPI002FCB3915
MFEKLMENAVKTLLIIWNLLLALCFYGIVAFLGSKVTDYFLKNLIFLVLFLSFNKFILNKEHNNNSIKNHVYLIKYVPFLLISLGYILIRIAN